MKDTPIFKLLLKLSPPVMLALLIQSIYNIVDSYFVARYTPAGLTALSIIFPVQLLLVALATGTGAGLNILSRAWTAPGSKTRRLRSSAAGSCSAASTTLCSPRRPRRCCAGITRSRPIRRSCALGIQYAQIVLLSFVPAGAVMMFTAYFQGVNRGRATIAVTLLRQVLLLVPLAWVLHFFGLRRVWYTFALTEVLTLVLYRRGAPKATRIAGTHR